MVHSFLEELVGGKKRLYPPKDVGTVAWIVGIVNFCLSVFCYRANIPYGAGIGTV